MFEYSLEHIFSYSLQLKKGLEVIGPLPEGLRAHVYVTDGTIQGPKVNGKALPVGGNWAIVRTDGCSMIDYRLTFETHDNALIYVTCTGIADLGENAYYNYINKGGEKPSIVQHRTALTCHAAHDHYKWLNRLQCIGVGAADLDKYEVNYDVYALH